MPNSETAIPNTAPVVRPRALALLAGAAVATSAHVIALFAGVDMLVPAIDGEGTQQLATVGVAASAAGAVLIGWAAAWASSRFSARPRPVWLSFAILGLAASFVPVVAIEATTATKAVLVTQHLLVAAVVLPIFVRTLPRSG